MQKDAKCCYLSWRINIFFISSFVSGRMYFAVAKTSDFKSDRLKS